MERRKNDQSWFQTTWRAAMAWQYLIVCVFDFILFPILLGFYSVYTKSVYIPWIPLTLQGGGLYHLAMGAVVGVTSWSKMKEKLQFTKEPESDKIDK